jgi:hypothetical protein
MPRIQIPPIRTSLEDPDAANGGNAATGGRTAKEWYYFWQRSGEKLDGLVTYGKHADRPDPDGVAPIPDGALYLEQDRGSTFYQFQDGNWMYIAGVMWGTLSPDQRPADLTAPNDIGFEFWATDQTPVRKFLWSGSAWIEQTPALYGTHAERIAMSPAGIALGVLYIETDRSNVIYEMRNPGPGNVWVYVTGTMSGTLSPDQRPGDLGTQGAGFAFRATDTRQLFAWDGSAWRETAPQTPWRQDIDAAAFRLLNAGTVAIGTASPASTKLHVVRGADDTDAINVSGADATRFLVLQSNNAAGRILHWAGGSFGNLILNPAGGNVGVNKSNPASKFAVAGLLTFASNAAAITGGLTAGDFYTDGAGAVKVVF